MKDVTSLLIATTMLAVGGLGLFMYGNKDKSLNDPEVYNEDEYDDNSEDIKDKQKDEEEEDESGSSLKSFFNNLWGADEKEKDTDEKVKDLEEEEEGETSYYNTKSKAKKSKTKRQRKSVGTKRRY
jgi:hypothetical protein